MKSTRAFKILSIALAAAVVGQLKGLSTDEVLAATLENGKRFFNIKEG